MSFNDRNEEIAHPMMQFDMKRDFWFKCPFAT